MFTPSEGRLNCHLERLIGGKCSKAGEENSDPRRTFEPLVGLFWCVGCWRHVKGWRFGVHRSAVDVMRGKPTSDKSFRKELEPNKGEERPSIYDASVSFYGNNPPHGKLVV